MIALLQRVSEAAVHVNEKMVGETKKGILALIGIERGDSQKQADRLLQRVLAYRMFPDDAHRMNINVLQAGGGLLLVPQFTLVADTNSGNRPGFARAAEPSQGRQLFEYMVQQARLQMDDVATGIFGANMKVSLVNDGPVTFWLQVSP